MQTFFITANDTDVGKTYITGLLARHFADQDKTVQIVKAIQCGGSGDAEWARAFANSDKVACHTLLSYPEPLAPLAEANAATPAPTLAALLDALAQLPEANVRLIEGAGGIAVPIDPSGLDWRDFAETIAPDLSIVVVDNRLGSINQSRLLHHYMGDLPHAFILNEVRDTDDAVKISNLEAFHSYQLPRLGCVEVDGSVIDLHEPKFLEASEQLIAADPLEDRFVQKLEARKSKLVFRQTKIRASDDPILNLSDNDYLGLRQHPAVIEAAKAAVDRWGTSSSASPLVSGYTQAHADLERTLSDWHGGRAALVWNSGYAANQSVLKLFVGAGDVVIADRLIHNSLISGILQSGARLIRFQHNDLDQLESLLRKHHGTRKIHLVTESVYSMDGDYPDLQRIAYLKNEYDFTWFLDEAHALGWYGAQGSGLAEAAGVLGQVDVLTGTMGKALASSGAYTIFNQSWMRDTCINEAGEFIYSTYLPPASAAAAEAAIELVRRSGEARARDQRRALAFREALRAQGWNVFGTDSAVVPVICGSSENALSVANALLESGIRVAAIRPSTVPQGAARVRLSLKATLSEADYTNLTQTFAQCAKVYV
jgi:8-amino-7-oxononanoate synthase